MTIPSETPDMAAELKRLRELAATCYAGLGAECNLPENWLDALLAASNGEPFSVDGLLPFKAQPATCGNTPYDEGPFTLAQQPAPSAAADLIAALEEARRAINSMKVEAETAAQGDEQMMLEACETISNEGLQADMAISAALAAAPQPSPTPRAAETPGGDTYAEYKAWADAASQCEKEPHAELRKSWAPGQRWQTRIPAFTEWFELTAPPAWFWYAEYRRHPEDVSPTPQADSQPAPVRDESAARATADSVTAPAGVAYLDIGAGGYIDLGTDLSNEALSRLPKGRHVLIIAGTYGIDGYTPTQLAQAADSALEDAAPQAMLSPQVSVSANTLLWWRELVTANPQDLVPRIDAYLDAARKQGGKP